MSPEEERAAREDAERQAVVDSYANLGVVSVDGYLNMREAASTDADVIGKLRDAAPARSWTPAQKGGTK